jgi:DNA-binding NarL/FixJ family response regulator
VITSSNQPSDVHKAYDLGANAYLVKPGSFDGLLSFAKVFKSYWLQTNSLAPMNVGGGLPMADAELPMQQGTD